VTPSLFGVRSSHHCPYAAVVSPVLSVERALSEHAAAQEALAWAIPLITVEAAARAPVRGGWSVAQNLAHLVVYEELIALPILGASLRHEDGARYVRSFSEDWFAPESESLATAAFPQLLTRYDMGERRHAELLAQFDDEKFNTPLCSAWPVPGGRLVSAGWVAKKSLQHTWEHGNVLLRAGWMALV